MKRFADTIENKNLREAYRLTEKTAPLGGFDCGGLCSALCCKGDECKGMYLYPGEAEILQGIDGFNIIESEGNLGYPTLVCEGRCDRSTRPLACRFFPLFPFVFEENGELRLSVDLDPRAGICPLADENVRFHRGFVRSVRRAALYLMRDEKILAYLKETSAELLEIIALNNLLG